ncbi:MAG TPA: TonB-dependent receptor [Terracidiphilus sp.]|jgi:hypothetical protein
MAVMLSSLTLLNAQQLTATLNGLAADQSDARVPGANIVIKNDATGDIRHSQADSSGYWSVTALIPGSYTVTVSAKGFTSWEMNGIVLNQGDSRTVPNIHLKVGSETAEVTVISGADVEVPVDNAEVSATLNNELVDSAVLTGRNAAELIKMMPGVAFSNNGGAGSAYNSQVTGTNNGPAGSFSANGTQPYGSTAVILDGANLIDPGNAGTQVANINQDMTDSVKYLSASYGAEYAKGPAVLQAFSKSGGQKYHGEAYIYARNTGLGYANDWNAKYQALAAGNNPTLSPQDFYYIGGNIGGPISFLGFNKNKDKLFFWAGYENMIQHPYTNPVQFNVPTPAQRAGDFTNPGLDPNVYDPSKNTGRYVGAYALPCDHDDGWQGCNSTNSPWVGSTAGQTTEGMKTLGKYFDPVGVAVTNLNPMPNQTPNVANGWNNFAYAPSLPQNRWELTGKVTYAFNDNNKLWGSYALQKETDEHPLSIWWTAPWTVPYPSQPTGKLTANVYLANYTHVFSPTSTNEFVYSYAKFQNQNTLSNPEASSRKALGLPSQSAFGTPKTDQMPSFEGGWDTGTTWVDQFDFNSGIYGANTFGKTSSAPAISDTFTKIVKTHSLKAGFYWDEEGNLQSNGDRVQGQYSVANWGASSTYNETLDRLIGRNQSYLEQNFDAVPDIKFHQWSLWAQDSWKATAKVTLNIGLRADHEGQWYDTKGGTQVWNPVVYDNTANPPANTGLQWHANNSDIPVSGFHSPLFLWNPRVGVAYDVFGTGKTVVRGGFGTYRYQISGNDASGAMSGPLGSFPFNTGSTGQVQGFYGYGIQDGVVFTNNPQTHLPADTTSFALVVPQGVNQVHVDGVKADKMGDNKVPYADTYSFGIAQALPSHTVMEISYVGSASRNQWLNGANGHISDANPVPYGAFFNADPIDGKFYNVSPYMGPGITVNSKMNHQHYHPLQNYGHIWIQTHGGYANYNSLQVSAQKQSGNLYLFTNFTFGKVLGTRDGSTSNGNGNGPTVDPFNLDANYGPLQYDHTKIFNFSASYKLPKPVHNNAMLGMLVNGWQLTTYTSYEDGSPYQATNQNMNVQYNPLKTTAHPDGQVFTMPIKGAAQEGTNNTTAIGWTTWFGTEQSQQGLQPVLICDPRKNLAKGQYFNPNCFVAPLPPTADSVGQMGQVIWPYIRTPHYFNSDLAVFKAFRITDAQRIEVRISATNWLNHPNPAFGVNGANDNQLRFTGVSTGSTLVSNDNAQTTGTPAAKLGYRWMQFAAKYYF